MEQTNAPEGQSPGGGSGKVFREAKYGATAASGGCIGGGAVSGTGGGLESLDYLVGVSRGLPPRSLARSIHCLRQSEQTSRKSGP